MIVTAFDYVPWAGPCYEWFAHRVEPSVDVEDPFSDPHWMPGVYAFSHTYRHTYIHTNIHTSIQNCDGVYCVNQAQ